MIIAVIFKLYTNSVFNGTLGLIYLFFVLGASLYFVFRVLKVSLYLRKTEQRMKRQQQELELLIKEGLRPS